MSNMETFFKRVLEEVGLGERQTREILKKLDIKSYSPKKENEIVSAIKAYLALATEKRREELREKLVTYWSRDNLYVPCPVCIVIEKDGMKIRDRRWGKIPWVCSDYGVRHYFVWNTATWYSAENPEDYIEKILAQYRRLDLGEKDQTQGSEEKAHSPEFADTLQGVREDARVVGAD